MQQLRGRTQDSLWCCTVPSQGLPSWHKEFEAEEWPSSHQQQAGFTPCSAAP